MTNSAIMLPDPPADAPCAGDSVVPPDAGRNLPPCLVIDGGSNALSIARSLGRLGVAVYALSEREAHVRYSRYCRRLEDAGFDAAAWTDFLTGDRSDRFRGSVLLAASDAGLQLIARNRDLLAEKFLLDLSNPIAQEKMLDKLATYRAAVEAGVPTPRFWVAGSRRQLESVRGELIYPLLVKPLLSHLFQQRFGRKFLIARSWEELLPATDMVEQAGIEVMLVEQIPGPDSRLCSYYTYLDESGRPLFDFTKRIIRRWPAGMGNACYHVTDHVPHVRELGLRLFEHVGLLGLANVEFKLDPRDGQLKLIECNARFTAANGLVADAGLDLARFVYNRLVGLPLPPMDRFRVGVRLWYPWDDFHAFRQLQRRGELGLGQWLASLAHRQTYPFLRLRDPWPTIVAESRRIAQAFRRRLPWRSASRTRSINGD